MERVGSQAPAAEGRKAFPLRLPLPLHAAVSRLASSELRSANAQVESMLRSRMARPGPLGEAAPGAVLAQRNSERKALSLRLPAAFFERLRQDAESSGMSVNARIELLLASELALRGASR